MKTRLAAYLTQRFRGVPLNQAADQTGISPSTLGRILRGLVSPSFENVLRLAWSLRVHPALLHELQGETELAFLYRRLFPEEERPAVSERDLYEAHSIRFHERVQRLIDLGLAKPLHESLNRLEGAWAILGPAFEQTAQKAGAKAAVLIVDFPKRSGEVFFRWECREPTARALAEAREMTGWESFSHEAGGLTLTLFLKEPKAATSAETIAGNLQMWAAGLISLSS